MEDRYLKHAQATAICVELALSAIRDEVRAELSKSEGKTSEALQRVLDQIQKRQRSLEGLISKQVTVRDMMEELSRQAA